MKCKYHKGIDHIDATHTKIGCGCVEGGLTYANNDPEGQIVSKCWSGGAGCPYKMDHEAATSIISDERAAEIEAELDREEFENEQLSFAEIAPALISQPPEKLETAPISPELQDKAATLHRRILMNGRIAAESIVAMAKDLKTMRDEKLYACFGCKDFDDYCVQKLGFHQRQGYNFIRVLEQYGDKQLAEVSHLGIAKLVELTALDPEDRQELITSGAAEEMSVRELKEKISELQSRCEQLTLDIEDERDKNRTLSENSEAAELETQVEELKAKLEEYEKNEDIYVNRLVDYEKKDKETAEKASTLEKELAELREKNAELESRPIDVAVQPPSEEELEKIREAARAEERKLHKEELKKVREKADAARLTAVEAARKQEADKLAAEIEKLKAENAVLKSNASPSAPPDSDKERIKFYLEECQRSFNSALEVVGRTADAEAKDKYMTALKTVVAKMEGVINA